MRHKNPYANLSALLDSTRKLTDEEMAELQLELGYSERALLIYEQLLRKEPLNAFYRRRCEWLARLVRADERSARRPAARVRNKVTTRHGSAVGTRPSNAAKARVEPESPAAVRPLEIISVGR